MNLAVLVSALGIAQIISWGSLFYAIGVLGPAMRLELGVSELYLFTAFTAGLALSGTIAPRMGRLIDRRGGGYVLTIGTLLAIVAMTMLALAPNAPVMVAGWLIAGAAMAACLYDPAFATLAQHTGPRYRRAVTALTLFGGFASTVFWPLSHLLLEAWGWRAAFGIYAAIHLLVCLPIHRFVVPDISSSADNSSSRRRPGSNGSGPGLRRGDESPAPRPKDESPAFGDPRLNWLAASFALATFIFGVIAVHMISLLTTAGLTAGQAVTISMLAGPMQVAGRLIEMGFASRVRPITVGLSCFVLMFAALVALIAVDGMGAVAIFFVVAYGFGNGVLTIVRGTAPVELFGAEGLGGLLGYLSRAVLWAKAIAPAAFSAMLTLGLTRNASLAVLAGLSVAGLATYLMAARGRHKPESETRQV